MDEIVKYMRMWRLFFDKLCNLTLYNLPGQTRDHSLKTFERCDLLKFALNLCCFFNPLQGS